MTAEMCRIAAADGTTHMVATPHANDEFDYDRERYTRMLGELSDAAEGKLTFSLGCDFHFSYDNIQDALKNPRRYTIGDSQYLLVEFSNYGLPPSVKEDLFALSSSGMTPVITHPERNPILVQRPERVLELVEQGCLVQVTAGSFTGFWGARAKKAAEWLLKRDAVHVIASDTHDPVRRTPVLSQGREAVARLTSKETAAALVKGNPAAMLDGKSLPYQPMLR
jgi:protein-tyrosine phosphatase